jgi:hypothetical protein
MMGKHKNYMVKFSPFSEKMCEREEHANIKTYIPIFHKRVKLYAEATFKLKIYGSKFHSMRKNNKVAHLLAKGRK